MSFEPSDPPLDADPSANLGNADIDSHASEADQQAFDALNVYAERGERTDQSLGGLFDCLDRLEALGTESSDDTRAMADTSSLTGIPEKLGDYRIGDCVGRGGMGTVYRGEHVTMGHSVAIKVIPADSSTPKEVVDRFYQEARAAAGEEHPHVVAVRHVGREAGLHYLVMDLVRGQTLADRLLDGPMPWREAVALLVRVADAIRHLHERGVIHRDLKPSNILLDNAGRPYVTDFGLAKLTGAVARTHSRTLVGTPRYMSPEQASGKAREVGPESDIFSLGAIFYECLTGRPAFDADHPLDAVLQVIETEPPPLKRYVSGVPRDVERIMLNCLEKDRGSRYTQAQHVADDLRACLAGEAISQRRSSVVAFTRRVFRRRPALLLRLFGIGAIALVVQLAHWTGVRPPEETVGNAAASVMLGDHYNVMAVITGWFITAILLHLIMGMGQKVTSRWLPYAWSFVDTFFLTWTLAITLAPLEAPAVGYPCVIAVAGVWLRPPVVWFTTLITGVGYALLHIWHHATLDHFPFIFLAGLALVGVTTVHQVQRVRWLTAVSSHEELSTEPAT